MGLPQSLGHISDVYDTKKIKNINKVEKRADEPNTFDEKCVGQIARQGLDSPGGGEVW